MRTITLSNHTQDQASAAADQRQAQYEADIAGYRRRIEQRSAKAQQLRRASADAWSDRRFIAWTGFQLARLFHALSAMPHPPQMAQASREEIVWQAGSEGERRVIETLSRRLSDDWVGICGYCNPGGEVDLLLVGPPGVMAVEIKYLNGRIHCDGDRWWRDKYDKYGNLVEQAVPIADRGGRGPSAQVNAAADRLQRFLSERTPVQRVARAVVFSHEASQIGSLQRITVEAVTVIDAFDVPAVFQQELPGSARCRVDELVRLIAQDHSFHQNRGGRGGSRPSRSRASQHRPAGAVR